MINMKSSYILLNVGLAPSAIFGGSALTHANVCDTLSIAGAVITHIRRAYSTTEETSALRIRVPEWCKDHDHVKTLIHSLAVILRQEAIAWSYETEPSNGFLTGPHAAAWGAFDYDKFILPRGVNPPQQ